uniref:RAB, member of RAS oncogene family-like 2 n=1 Tax=Hucho hucho TaxID=62062 RepID=A0A4W5KV55_9TELE
MASDANGIPELDQDKYDADEQVKIICLGDSAVGKSKLMERFLIDGYRPQQLSTYALTLYKYNTTIDRKAVLVDFWDTAGQERFQSMHPSYYHKAHACIMVFDVQRKITYKNLTNWYTELREYRPEIPCVVVANKIDGETSQTGLFLIFYSLPILFFTRLSLLFAADMKVTQRNFNFAKKQGLPLYFVSAADGTNVVKMFKETIKMAMSYKQNSSDFMDEVMRELENFELEQNKDLSLQTAQEGLKPESPESV